MSIISYAQNFEDIMLWRALGHLTDGFYIDVGANDPYLHSTTKLFYDFGWHGINIEPVDQWFERLEQERPRDANLNIAAGSEAATVTFYDFPDTGLSTSIEEIANYHDESGRFEKRVTAVDVRTLSDICGHYCPAEIHFLKIDVEGSEANVLEGMDFRQFRPWIVLVESTLPLQERETYSEWEPNLLIEGYRFVYFDGLNRFYLAEEKFEELRSHFDRPPNNFDDFELAGFVRVSLEKDELAQALTLSETRLEVAEGQAKTMGDLAGKARERCTAAEMQLKRAEIQVSEQRKRAEEFRQSLQNVSIQAEERVTKAQAELNEAAIQVSKERKRTEGFRQSLQNVSRQAEERVTKAQGQVKEAKKDASEQSCKREISHQHSKVLEDQLAAIIKRAAPIDALLTEARGLYSDALARAKSAEERVSALESSFSWQATLPMRRALDFGCFLSSLPLRFTKSVLEPALAYWVKAVLKKPLLRSKIVEITRRLPFLNKYLISLAEKRSLLPETDFQPTDQQIVKDFGGLTPRSREIFATLKQLIDSQDAS